uniref:Uncharacterized protein n=1 Tax=Acrobeloides nanus TaxID=290746 RepID=A0A914D4J6_9BILA
MIIDEEPTQSEMSATPPPIGFKPLPTTSTIIQRRACQDNANASPSSLRASVKTSNIDQDQEPVWRMAKPSPQPPKVRLKQLPPIITPQPDRFGPYEDDGSLQSALV